MNRRSSVVGVRMHQAIDTVTKIRVFVPLRVNGNTHNIPYALTPDQGCYGSAFRQLLDMVQ